MGPNIRAAFIRKLKAEENALAHLRIKLQAGQGGQITDDEARQTSNGLITIGEALNALACDATMANWPTAEV